MRGGASLRGRGEQSGHGRASCDEGGVVEMVTCHLARGGRMPPKRRGGDSERFREQYSRELFDAFNTLRATLLHNKARCNLGLG
jgi:hypothetical protein